MWIQRVKKKACRLHVCLLGWPPSCLTCHLGYACSVLNPRVVVQLLSRVQLFATPWTAARQASLAFTISRSLPRCMSIELVMLFNHLILHHPFSFCLQSCPGMGSLPMSWRFASHGHSIGASVSVLPMNIQG